MTYPTISPQFDSDAQGKPILEGILATHLILRPGTPDFFVDYYAELRDGREPSGKIVWLQLKSKSRVADNALHVGVQFTLKVLRYYASRATCPVFVVAVDITRKRAYYLFIQAWLADRLNELASSSDKARITVNVPIANDVSDLPAFLTACGGAVLFMRERFPGSPEAAAKHVADELNQLDPRFQVELSTQPGGRHYYIAAKSPTPVTFTFGPEKAQEAARQLNEAIEFGRRMSLTDVRLAVSGSPLFEHMLSGGGLTKLEWGPAREVACSVELSCGASENVFSFQLPATLGAGLAGFSVTTTADDCPFRLHDNIRLRGDGAAPCGDVRLDFSTRAWEGQPVLHLPWFDSVMAFVRATRAAHPVRFALIHKGRAIFSGMITTTWRRRDRDILWWFDRVQDICEIATALQRRVVLPIIEHIRPDSMKGCALAVRLLREGRTEVDNIRITRDDTVPPDEFWAGVLADIDSGRTSIRGLRGRFPHSFTFLGEPASLGQLNLGPCDVLIRRVDRDHVFEVLGIGGAQLELTLHRDAKAAPM